MARPEPVPVTGRPLRLAWVGTEPRSGDGASGAGWLIMQGLAAEGCEIDCYCAGNAAELERRYARIPGVRVVNVESGWQWGRWYSRHKLVASFTGLASRAWGRQRLAAVLLERHRQAPYDALYQFSTIETFGLRRKMSRLPPLIIHPQTHIAGELRWVRLERALAARCEPRWRRLATESLLTVRKWRQRRDIQLASRIVMISRRFGALIEHDCGLRADQFSLARNPVDLTEIVPRTPDSAGGPVRIAFVGRISVRKGVELVVALSHRLADLAGEVVLDVVGDHTLWSDYRPLLVDLNPAIARYLGPMNRAQVIALLSGSDLMVQPARYEPFGLTVSEALALGTPVVASDEVGAAEDVSRECCPVVPSGDIDALEAAVRTMITRVRTPGAAQIRATARTEAERLFSPEMTTQAVLSAIRDVLAEPPSR